MSDEEDSDCSLQSPRKRARLDSYERSSEIVRLSYHPPVELNANEIAQLCYETFQKLPAKSGYIKTGEEYTILAGIVCNESIVSLATGTKCFPDNVRVHDTCIVDCHAESLLKRAFKCHLYSIVREHLSAGGVLSQLYSDVLKNNRYTLFVSQVPCGTVSRWKGDKIDEQDNIQDRTINSDEEFSRNYKHIGVNRKPGRGPICPSAGCIHKIAKWLHFGFQGRRLYGLLGNIIPIDRLVIGNCEEYSVIKNYNKILKQIISRITVSSAEQTRFCDKHSQTLSNLFGIESKITQGHQDWIQFAEQLHDDFMRSEFLEGQKFFDDDSGIQQQRRPLGVSVVAWKNGKTNCMESKNDVFVIEKLSSGRKHGTSMKNANRLLTKVCNKSLLNEYENIIESLKITENRAGMTEESDNTVKNAEKKPESTKNENENKNKESELLENIITERQELYSSLWNAFQTEISIFKGWPKKAEISST